MQELTFEIAFMIATSVIGLIFVLTMVIVRLERGQKLFESDREWHNRFVRSPEQFNDNAHAYHDTWVHRRKY